MLLTLLSVLALFACTDRRYPTTLVVADSLCAVNPDSALHLLTQYKDSIQTASKAHRMYYHLLLADAMNKAYVDMSTDSILKEVADYYDRHGSANEQMRAHYLLGCAYRDMGEAPMALQCYQDAVDKADTLSQDCNYRLLTSVYGQMAEIFHKQNLPTDEIIANRNCQKYSLMGGDSLEYLLSIKAMIKPYFLLGDTLAMMKVLDDVYQLFLKRGDSLHASRTYGSSVYIDKLVREGRLSEARKRINTYKAKSGLYDNQGNLKGLYSGYYYYEGMYYLKAGQLDSAEHCFRKLTNNKNYHLEECHGLMMLYQQRRATDSIIKYVQEYSDAVDEQANSRRTETVHQMTSMYNYQRYQQEAAMAKLNVANQKLRYGSLLLLTFVILLCVGYYLHKAQKQRKLLQKNYEENTNQLARTQTELTLLRQHHTALLEIAESTEMELQDTKEEIQELQQQREQYQAMIDEKKAQIRLLGEEISHYQRKNKFNRMMSEKQLQEWEYYKKIQVMAQTGTSPSPEEWHQLRAGIIDLLPGFHVFLSSHEHLMNLNEYNTCILVRLHVKPTAIANMLGVSGPYISKIRVRLSEILFDDPGKPGDFDKKIQSIY